MQSANKSYALINIGDAVVRYKSVIKELLAARRYVALQVVTIQLRTVRMKNG